MHPHVLKKIIIDHDGSINSLSFSQDGSLFASGGDDGLIIIFQGHGSGREIYRFRVRAPVTTLLWHSLFDNAILAGDASGYVHVISIPSNSMTVSASYNYHMFRQKPQNRKS
jgi:WD40 repeat protein